MTDCMRLTGCACRTGEDAATCDYSQAYQRRKAKPELHPEGFYKIRLEGQPGVAYCQHNGPWGDEPKMYETWTTLHLFTRFDERPHPASATITPRSDRWYFRNMEILEPIEWTS